MSDSELSDARSVNVPPDSVIETSLREEVKRAAKGPSEDYTVSKIRKSVEKSLELPDGFFKGDTKWKLLSKAVIEKQVAKESDQTESGSPKKQDTSSKPECPPDNKRVSSSDKQRPRKKQKLEADGDTSDLSSPPSDPAGDSEEQVKTKRPQKEKPKSRSKPEPESNEDSNGVDEEADDDGRSGSEMSVVLDDAPVKKQRSKSKSVDKSDKKSAASKPKTKAGAVSDPDQEEIKKLQGWLVKCGVRKVWGKELKPFESSKAKIKHLKGMLAEVGMGGRFSNEKAAQIKEARELAADIEAVQEGNERWGKDGDDGDGDDGELKSRSGRRLVRGAKNYDFLSSDGEETD